MSIRQGGGGGDHPQQHGPLSLTACNEQLIDVLQDLRGRRQSVSQSVCLNNSNVPPPPFPRPPYPTTIIPQPQVHRDVQRAEKEKGQVQRELQELQERLAALDSDLGAKLQARAEYDRTIRETEAAYAKIVESSETLLRVLRREATHLEAAEQQQQQQQKGGAGVVAAAAASSSSSSSLLLNGGKAAVTGAGHAGRGGVGVGVGVGTGRGGE